MNESVWAEKLARIEKAGLLRTLRRPETGAGRNIVLDGRELVNFGSNDYLALATCERLARAACEATRRWGSGAAASRLVTGNLPLYAELERELAAFKKAEAACVLPTGYMANLAIIQTLADQGTTFYVDKLAHASIIDGVRLSGAKLRVWRHNDPSDLKRALEARPAAARVVVTETLFSMDGCIAPLGAIIETARRFDACVILDDAHATGVFGPGGVGLAAQAGLDPQRDLVVTTFSKALGGLGGAVTGPAGAIRLMHNRARPLIFSTALPPGVLAAGLEALRAIGTLDKERERILSLAEKLRAGAKRIGFDTLDSASQIVPVVAGSPTDAARLAAALAEAGFFAPPIRPPAVPKGTSRVRLSVTAYHTESDITGVLEALRDFRA